MTDYIAEHKVQPYTVSEMTNQTPGFYDLLGPWLSRREVVSELGGPVWDDDGKEWIIAHNESVGLLGMVALRRRTVCSLYVTSGARGQLVGTTLVLRLILRHGDGDLRAVATPASLALFEGCGFRPRREHGRYTVLERKP